MTIICDTCQKRYDTVNAVRVPRIEIVADYAQCTHCGTPKRPFTRTLYKPEELCERCHIPKKLAGYYVESRALCFWCFDDDRRQQPKCEESPTQTSDENSSA